MKHILNITNGDCAIEVMKKAKLPGDFLPWRDVLHDGPVPADLGLEELSKVRAEFIAQQGWQNSKEAQKSFTERDDTLKQFTNYDKVILWFEHDLYDQLQLIQLLDWFGKHLVSHVELTMICVDQYLGPLSPEELLELLKYEKPVSSEQLALANETWAAFRAATPEPWAAMLKADTSALPFLEGAIIRMLEEYPSCNNGLSRTAHQALSVISKGESRPGRIFGGVIELEERRFMGDSSFWKVLHGFLDSNPPLLDLREGKTLTLPTSPDQALSITPTGQAVLNGQQNWLDIQPIDRWIGGVHLTAKDCWCWDSQSRVISKQ